MPLGVQQNNDFTQFTMDVWNDKIFYQEKEFPAGFMAMSILNIPEEDLPELIQAGGAPTFLFPVVVQGSDEEAAALFPQLRERILYLTELLWKYPPFCYNDYEKEMRRINILFDERNLLQIRTPDSEFQTEFLRFCVGIIRIPIAMYHFYAAGRFFELDYLRRLKKRNETHFAVAAHDCFNSEQFWDEMRSLQSLDMEPFTVYPELSSTYVFARSPKNEKEMVYVLETGETAKFLDARLDIVAGDFFALVNLVDSDIVFYSLIGVDGLLGNVEAELLLGFHDRNPQVAFEKYFSFGAPNLFYFF